MTQHLKQARDAFEWLFTNYIPKNRPSITDGCCNMVRQALLDKEIDGGWQPIETAPMKTEVWCYVPDFGKAMPLVCELEPTGVQYPQGDARQQYVGRWRRPDRNSFAQNPTHWMPLPKPPAKDE